MPSQLPKLRIVDAAAVSTTAAGVIADTLAAAIAERGAAHWATTGGSAAPGFYRALVAEPLRSRVRWDAVHTWWGDDRFVPFDHPLSNVLPFEEILMGPTGIDAGQTSYLAETAPQREVGIAIPPANLHRWPIGAAIAGAEGPGWAAARYADELRAVAPSDPTGTPVLDLVVLGVGPDGHVLSVFPGSAVWDEPSSCAGVPAPTHVEPHVERVTMHPRVIAAARTVLVVTSGSAKAPVLARAWTGDDLRELPVRAARLPTATWVVDEAAAAALPRG